MIKYALILLFLPTALSFSQVSHSIDGKVINENNQVIPGIVVTLVSSFDQNIIKSEITDSLGHFSFLNFSEDSVFLSIREFDYQTYKGVTLFFLENQTLNIAPITLTSSTVDLGEVAILGKKAFIKMGIDRVTITPEALISNAGLNAYELLLKSPGVSADNNENLQLKGKSGVLILIDNKPTYLTGNELANYLKSIPSSMVATIELIPIPPAQYDAAGSSGVININLKRSKKVGFNGNLNSSYGQGRYASTRHNLNLNYTKNKISIFSSISASIWNTYQDLYIYREYQNDAQQTLSYFNQRTYIRKKGQDYNARLGFDYYLNETTTIGVSARGVSTLMNDFSDNHAELLDSLSNLNKKVLAQNTDDSKLKNLNFNLNLRKTLDTLGSNITFNGDYIRYDSKIDQHFNNQTLAPDNSLLYKDRQQGLLPSLIDIYTLKVDYTKMIEKFGKLELGVKSSFINTNNKALYYKTLNEVTDTNYQLSNQFLYGEMIHAAYVNYTKEFKRIELQLGLRSETTVLNGNQLGNKIIPSNQFKRNYTNLFPSVFIGFHLDTISKNMLVLSYGSRINRPNFSDLNPFVSPLDQYTFYGGNPFLKPSFSNALSLSFNSNPHYAITLSYSDTRDGIQETIEIENSIYFSRPGNIGSNKQVNLSINSNFEIKKWWNVSIYVEGAYLEYRSKLYTETLNATGTYLYGQINNSFTLKKGWSAELSADGITDLIESQFSIRHFGKINIGIQKKILKNKATCKVSLSDLFFTNQITGQIHNLNNTLAGWKGQRDTRILNFSFSYRFGKSAEKANYKSGSTDSEEQRLN
jgi:outer membrane receptor protein involved in Fe transport